MALMLPNRRSSKVAEGLDQPGVKDIEHPARERGPVSCRHLTQAGTGDGELELRPLVDEEDAMQCCEFVSEACDAGGSTSGKKRHCFEDDLTEVVERLKRRGIEVHPAGQTQPRLGRCLSGHAF